MPGTRFALRRIVPKSRLFAAVLGLLVTATQPMWAQTETVLYSFPEIVDGAYPYDSLVRDAKGNLYGTTNGGGVYSWGTVFEVTMKGTEKVLYNFTGGADGGQPIAGLVLDKQGNLFGTTPYGGASFGANGGGVVFELTPAGTETVLYTFIGGADGANPYGGLVRDAKGNLYGATANGGAYGWGAVFEVTPTGAETVLYSFTGGADGANPYGGLVRDAKGNLYGTTYFGGDFGYGTVFEVTSAGIGKGLYSFTGGADGGNPIDSLVRDAKGNFYGTTQRGGTYAYGTVFEVTKKGVEKVLYSFMGGGDGQFPDAGLVLDKQGNLYGTTHGGGASGYGTAFEVAPAAGTGTVLHSFTGNPDGASPTGGLVRDAKGNLYGTTNGGGNGYGTVFKLTP